MEAFLARAARWWPAALAWETILVCGNVSAGYKAKGALVARVSQKGTLQATERRWSLYTKLPLALTGLELDYRLAAVVELLLPANLTGCLV